MWDFHWMIIVAKRIHDNILFYLFIFFVEKNRNKKIKTNALNQIHLNLVIVSFVCGV